jgi:hypothetical protein
MFVGAKFISPVPLKRLNTKLFAPLTRRSGAMNHAPILKGYHHGGGVREDADLLVTPYTVRCAGYEPKTKMVSVKDTDFLPSA